MSRTVIPFPGPRTATGDMRTSPGDVRADRVAGDIARHGFHLVHVGERCACGGCGAAPLPPDERFGYTVGLTGRGHPELLVRGLSGPESAELLDRWGRAVLDGADLAAGHLLCEGPGGRRWVLARVARTPDVLVWATRFYRPAGLLPRTALELVRTTRRCRCEDCG